MARFVKSQGRSRTDFVQEQRLAIVGSFVLLLVAAMISRADQKDSGTASTATAQPSAVQTGPSAAGPDGHDSIPAGGGQPGQRARVALADTADTTRAVTKLAQPSPKDAEAPEAAEDAAIGRAIQTMADCKARYQSVNDYVCTFYKRERVNGNLTSLHVMSMKVRTKPQSIYFKFQRPARGREAIYIAGRNDGKILAHDVGLNKFLAGTLALEPNSSRAMEENRHPITEAGIGPLIDTLASRWAVELNPKHSRITFRDDMLVGNRTCLLIESVHPHRNPQFLFHKVRVFIDDELGLPIRFEAYDWPKLPHAEPELAEEYTYNEIRLNTGLQEVDFDVSNKEYAFGRF